MLATPVVAQTPSPTTTAFDGTYTGTRNETTPGRATRIEFCPIEPSVRMTVRRGQVTVLTPGFQGTDIRFRGSVSAEGEVSAQAAAASGRLFSVTGIIRSRAFTGEMTVSGRCYYSVTMALK
jgi:hypothetical protein